MNPRILRVAAVLGLAWVCGMSGCARDRSYSASPVPGDRTAYRPPFDRLDVKPMYVGGYAGYDYDRASRPRPLRVRPMASE